MALVLETSPADNPFRDSKAQLELLERLACDEQNLTELALGTLKYQPLTLDPETAEEAVQFGSGLTLAVSKNPLTSKHELPAALSQRLLLGLLWLTREQTMFREPRAKFKLRRLVQDFMYPHRTTAANNEILVSSLLELHRLASIRIHAERWYDAALGKTRVADLALIADILYPPGMSAKEISHAIKERRGRGLGDLELEIVWGPTFWKSICAKYTKPLDIHTWLRIERPLDQKLYRFLDRQCSEGHRARGKKFEIQPSCIQFAQRTLGMRGQRIDRGGRTASGYIVRELEKALERLEGIGAAFRMHVDTSPKDHSLAFERIEGEKNEVRTVDDERDLHRAFMRIVHGVPEERLAELKPPARRDRRVYAKWLGRFEDLDTAIEIVKRAHQALKDDPKAKTSTPHNLSRLERYWTAAEAALLKKREEQTERENVAQRRAQELVDGQISLGLEAGPEAERLRLFEAYKSALAEHPLDPETEARVEKAARTKTASYQHVSDGPIFERFLRLEIYSLRLEEHEALDFETFSGLPVATRPEALRAHHGFDVVI